MNPDVKAKWLNLLRSETYEQGSAQLGADPVGLATGETPRRCCLGVLCEVAVQEGVIEKKVTIDGDVIYGVGLSGVADTADDSRGPDGDWESAKFYLPKAVREWAELPHYSPTVPAPAEVNTTLTTDAGDINLSTLNDSVRGYDFHKIADMVEEHL